jgi:hypothetical protein
LDEAHQNASDAGSRAVIDAKAVIGSHDILFMTLDTLRYDVAHEAAAMDLTPTLAAHLPGGQWERRHTPGSFTYAAHQAFFAGFLPTPAEPGEHERLFALRFAGSRTTGGKTATFDAPDIVTGLAEQGYHTICIGGVGFFNKQTPLGYTLPRLFAESHWSPRLGVTSQHSAREQVRLALARIEAAPSDKRIFLFINISALHHPNRMFTPGAKEDSRDTQRAALAYVDGELPPLFAGMRRRGSWLCIICSDHGTAYGDDGYRGHRLCHPSIWDVPYAEFILAAAGEEAA